MLIFDMPQRGECTVRRSATSTPLQALVLLNDPQFVEASRVLAEKVLRTDNPSLSDRLEKTFRLITGRKPQAKETQLLQAHYEDEYEKFAQHPEDVKAYLSTGEQEVKADDRTELAALAAVANSIMNTYEAYTRK